MQPSGFNSFTARRKLQSSRTNTAATFGAAIALNQMTAATATVASSNGSEASQRGERRSNRFLRKKSNKGSKSGIISCGDKLKRKVETSETVAGTSGSSRSARG